MGNVQQVAFNALAQLPVANALQVIFITVVNKFAEHTATSDISKIPSTIPVTFALMTATHAMDQEIA